MATANETEDNVTISGEAVDLLGCFVAELDAIVLNIAKQIAKDRRPGLPEGATIDVEVGDVKAAAEAVLSYIRVQIAEGKLPSNMKDAVDGFERCFREKCADR
jgi:hypothetical protein